jgi:hypothetical protein
MLAQVVMLENMGVESGLGCPQQNATKGEARDVLENVRVLNGFTRGLAPDEWSVAGDENARNRDGIEIL